VRRLALVAPLAAACVVALAAAGCGAPGGSANGPNRFARCAAQPNDCNSGDRRSGGTFTVALRQPPPSFNVVSAPGAVSGGRTVMNSLLPGAYIAQPDGLLALNTDLLTSATMTGTHPQTVVYRIAPGAVWDDATPISGDDFVYAWKTQNGKDCTACQAASTSGYERIASVMGGTGGTVTVTFAQPYPDWQSLFGALYPAHIEGAGLDMSTQDGLHAAFERQAQQPKWSGGPYQISSYDRDTSIELVPNPHWYGAAKPTLSRITYRFLPDQSRMLAAVQTGEVDAFTAVPSQDLVDVLKGLAGSGVRYQVAPSPAWERLDLDVRSPALADPALRQAIFAAINVNEILKQAVKGYFPAVKRLYSHNLMPGATGYQEVMTKAAPEQGSGNVTVAKDILDASGYSIQGGRLLREGELVPALRLLYTQGNDTQQQAGELIRQHLTRIGLTVDLVPTSDLATALARYEYDMALFAWSAGPELVAARQMWATDGGNNHTGWGDPDSDELLAQAAYELDPSKMADELNDQDVILTQAAVVLPLYQRPDVLVVAGEYVNVRDNVAGWLSYNAQQWGLAGTAVPLSPSPAAS
jgi:peptide/nickel transport system substrate-binding protein